MKYPDSKEFLVLSDHLKYRLRFLSIADPHRIVDASLDGLQEEIRALSRRGYKLSSLPFEVQERKNTDAEGKESNGDDYYFRCKRFKNQLPPMPCI